MKFTKEQLEWIKTERQTLRRILDAKPEQGWLYYQNRLNVLNLFVELHNVAVKAEKEANEALQGEVFKALRDSE